MSPQSNDNANEPLPRKSRADTLAWAKRYTSVMAHYAQVDIAQDPAPRTHFEDCIGKGDEVADDGRFTLTYATYARLPVQEHTAAVRKLRAELKKHGVDVSDYAEDRDRPAVTLYGKNESEGFLIIADTVKPANTLRLSVSTGCFLPPGAEQQKF
ncbi:hypothetical protein RM550_31300 [Streptomyces sp. DSM 41527]|uniref:Uncharacterized protein n=1 Tax=Streptomyces mooreae TaxID=3075523 RepID=A0ABU2TGW7_9ACTN|nr:hypothetical protein [Streptomyces sp. DSM 41527]MDT0460155.1 hypothetical protein [Streptomyces sp. DSM 41527]